MFEGVSPCKNSLLTYPNLVTLLSQLARRTNRSESEIITEAPRWYMDRDEEQIAELRRAVQEADAGDFASDAEVQVVFGKTLYWRSAAFAEGLTNINSGSHTNLETIKAR